MRVTVIEAREILGNDATSLSDEEIKAVVEYLTILADISLKESNNREILQP